MTVPPGPADEQDPLPDAAVGRRSGLSVVWIIPITALAVGGWLAWTTFQNRGPTVTITFDSGYGIEAGKTKIKYKEVEIGIVDQVSLTDDFRAIVVTADMNPAAEPYLNDETRFWIVRPQVGAGGVSGLDTLVSGAFIGIDPGQGEPRRTFQGLGEPPLIRSDEPGTRYQLRADRLGSISRGAPIYFRGVEVGQVLGHEFADDGRSITAHAFIRAPFDGFVHDNSTFWNASGIEATVGADGVDIQTESVETLLLGGVAFDTPTSAVAAVAEADTVFTLHDSLNDVSEARFTEKTPYVVYFDESVRGLEPGATVDFRGIKVGEVTDVSFKYDAAAEAFRIPVTLELEVQRVEIEGQSELTAQAELDRYAAMAAFVERGLRAQLQSASLLTGRLLVALDFYPDAAPATLNRSGRYPAIPTIPSNLEALQTTVRGLMAKVNALPLDQLVADLRGTLRGADALLNGPETRAALTELTAAAGNLNDLLGTLNQRAGPLLESADGTLNAAENLIGTESQLRYDLTTLLRESASAARSIRLFADYLERHPEALIRGKGFGR